MFRCRSFPKQSEVTKVKLRHRSDIWYVMVVATLLRQFHVTGNEDGNDLEADFKNKKDFLLSYNGSACNYIFYCCSLYFKDNVEILDI